MLEVKTNKSTFSKRYFSEIKKWALNFDFSPSPILAISRKGPRLFELLYHDGLIDKSILDRVCSEYAIPFSKRVDRMLIVDDSVLYGSTIKDAVTLVKNKFSLSDSAINVIPLRYSRNAPAEIKSLIEKEFSVPISPIESPVHINQLIYSFKQLGKPYDLEFPILYLKGDFSDKDLLKEKLELVCKELGESSLIINNTPDYPDRYTILVRGQNLRGQGAGAEFSKIRVYVADDYQKIAFTPISPCIISNEDLIAFDATIAEEHRHLWTNVVDKLPNQQFDGDDYRSLIIWANYLKSLSFYTKRLPHFEAYFDVDNLEFETFDLQLLLGAELAKKIINPLSTVLIKKKKFVFFEQNYHNYTKINEFKIPADKRDSFFDCCDNDFEILKEMNSESEILNHFFRCQHTKIEISSRSGENFKSINRLKFGFTLNYIIKLIQKYIPNSSIRNIHFAFDQLIDLGAIVPKYLNLANESHKTIWGRVYRVGEGDLPTSKKILAILTLFENLKKKFRSPFILAVVLEKCTVLGLTNSFGFKELADVGITGLDIRKKFGLYGARSYIVTDANGSWSYLLDWAKSLKIIKQNEKDEYYLNESVAKTYDLSDTSITTTSKDKLEDIAQFCHFISNKLSEAPLVLFTTLASKKEFWQALSAELELWLNHSTSGIYVCINKLGEIRNQYNPVNSNLLISSNAALNYNANFAAQALNKKKLFEAYDETIKSIEALVDETDNSNLSRVWRDLKDYLDTQKMDSTQDYFSSEILSTLNICHTITSISRTLLNKAGFKDQSGKKRSISFYIESILSSLDKIKVETPLVWRIFDDSKAYNTLKNVIRKYSDDMSFEESFDILRPLLIEISDTIHKVYRSFGASPTKTHDIEPLPPPIYIVRWDIRKSSDRDIRTDIEQSVIIPIKEQIRDLLGPRKLENLEKYDLDDGGSFLTSCFTDVLSAFYLISRKAKEFGVGIRVACEINFLGELHRYKETRIIGGKAYEYAERLLKFYKEISDDPTRWQGYPVTEPSGTYLIISEFAKRFAEGKQEWSLNGLNETQLKGLYFPRVSPNLFVPYGVSIIFS